MLNQLSKTTQHIKAFTILEVVISIAIMSIIIAMVYTIYTLMSKQLFEYSDQTEVVNSYNQINVAFNRDLHNASKLVNVNKKIYLLSNRDTLQYELLENKLVRSSNKSVDTFQVKVSKFKLVEEDELLGNRIKRIQIDYEFFEQKIEALYIKDFGVTNQINKTFFEYGN